MARFRKNTGLYVPASDQGACTVYRIADADLLVDALQFLHLVEEVKSRAVDQAVDLAEEARDLWRSPPPTFGDLPCPDPEAYEALGSAFQFLKGWARRILIVDDRVGKDLQQRLDRHRYTVIRSLEAFNELREEQSLSAFDIAVVDLHLSDGYEDFQGDAIARTIHGMGIALPVVMMTLKPPTNRSIPEWIKKRGLVDVIYKEHDADGFSVDFVAERIEDLLAGDPVEAVCEQMVVQVHTLRRKAIRRHSRKPHALRDQYLKTMDDNANKITALAARGDLAAARLAMARFVSIWGE